MHRWPPGATGIRSGERRAARRVSPSLRGRAAAGDCRVHDISRNGVCLVLTQPLDTDAAILLELVDPPSGNACEFLARVVWQSERAPWRAGLRFEPLSPEQDRWLAAQFLGWLKADRPASGHADGAA